jgi:hypothetical protein
MKILKYFTLELLIKSFLISITPPYVKKLYLGTNVIGYGQGLCFFFKSKYVNFLLTF